MAGHVCCLSSFYFFFMLLIFFFLCAFFVSWWLFFLWAFHETPLQKLTADGCKLLCFFCAMHINVNFPNMTYRGHSTLCPYNVVSFCYLCAFVVKTRRGAAPCLCASVVILKARFPFVDSFFASFALCAMHFAFKPLSP